MKILLLLSFMSIGSHSVQTFQLHQIRMLYHNAPEFKQDSRKLNVLMLQVDTVNAAPVLICYKGANEMIQAKYAINPIRKLDKFNRGKSLIQKAFSRDTLNLEMRFIRYSIQNNLPSFLGYHDNLDQDKQFLLGNTRGSRDPELKEMIFNYLSGLCSIRPADLKQLKN